MVESGTLLMCCRSNPTEGSNPSLSVLIIIYVKGGDRTSFDRLLCLFRLAACPNLLEDGFGDNTDYWQENYHKALNHGKPWLDGNPVRGGSWSKPPRDCRSAPRCAMSAFYCDRTISFRVALS